MHGHIYQRQLKYCVLIVARPISFCRATICVTVNISSVHSLYTKFLGKHWYIFTIAFSRKININHTYYLAVHTWTTNTAAFLITPHHSWLLGILMETDILPPLTTVKNIRWHVRLSVETLLARLSTRTFKSPSYYAIEVGFIPGAAALRKAARRLENGMLQADKKTVEKDHQSHFHTWLMWRQKAI